MQMGNNPEEWGSFTGTAMLGGVRALTQYVVLIFVSATSMSTANTFTQVRCLPDIGMSAFKVVLRLE